MHGPADKQLPAGVGFRLSPELRFQARADFSSHGEVESVPLKS